MQIATSVKPIRSLLVGLNHKDFSINIPYYQRPYTWRPYQILTLINDFIKYHEDKNGIYLVDDDGYFAGPIVYAHDDNDSSQSYIVVDGQQRITTLYFFKFLQLKLVADVLSDTNTSDAYEDMFIQICSEIFTPKFNTDEVINPVRRKRLISLLSNDSNDDALNKSKELKSLISNSLRLKYDRQDLNDVLEICLSSFRILRDVDEKSHLFRLMKTSEIFEYTKNISTDTIITQNLSENEDSENYHTLIDSQSRMPDFYSVKNRDKIFETVDDCLDVIEDYESVKDNRSKLQRYIEGINTALISLNYIILSHAKVKGRTIKSIVDAGQKALKEFQASSINEFLKRTMLCQMKTVSSDDAFVLFEILNNRGIGLRSVDLIKNSFYKSCTERIDNVDKLDNLWSDALDADKKYLNNITQFLSFTYMTGNVKLDSKAQSSTRKVIRSIDEHFKLNQMKNESDLEEHFNVFNVVRYLLDLTTQGNKENEFAFKQLIDTRSSWCSKCISLLFALKQQGLLPLIVFPILAICHTKNTNIFKNRIKQVTRKDQIASIQDDRGQILETLAFEIIKNSIFIPTADIRAYVSDKFKHGNAFSLNGICNFKQDKNVDDVKNLIKELTKELRELREYKIGSGGVIKKRNFEIDLFYSGQNSFSYTQDPFRLKYFYLIAMLHGVNKGKNTFNCDCKIDETCEHVKISLINEMWSTEKLPGSLQLDHIEPQMPKDSGIYFQNADRGIYINSAPNLMLVFSKNNNQKSNNSVAGISISEIYKSEKTRTFPNKNVLHDELVETWDKFIVKQADANYSEQFLKFIEARRFNLIRIVRAISNSSI